MKALITGGNRGIGLEIARQLAKKGVEVILTARDEEKGRKAANSIEGNVMFHQLDVTDDNSIENLRQFLEKHGLDVLINNAGVLIDRSGFENTDMKTIQTTMQTNIIGPIRLCQALIPILKKSNDPRIVNMSSGLGSLSNGGSAYPVYSISKTALNMLTVRLAAENPDIRVNSMAPGWVRTDMGGPEAPTSVEEGADTAVWLATADVPTGGFFQDRKPIEW